MHHRNVGSSPIRLASGGVLGAAGLILSASLASATLAGQDCCPSKAQSECSEAQAVEAVQVADKAHCDAEKTAGCGAEAIAIQVADKAQCSGEKKAECGGEAIAAQFASHQQCDAEKAGCHGLPAGMQAHEERANTFTHSLQENASLATDPTTGRTLVVWESRRQEKMTYGVVAQAFDPMGRLLGTELRINETVFGPQHNPSVVIGQDGSAWVAWQSDGQDGSEGSIFIRQFNSTEDGYTPTGGEIAVNTTTKGHQSDPTITVNSDGQVLVAWTSAIDSQNVAGMARIFNAKGEAVTDEFAIAEDSGTYRSITSTTTEDGRFILAWDRVSAENQPAGLFVRGFNANGEAATDAVRVSEASGIFGSDWHIEPSIDADAHGHLVVGWLSTSEDGSGWDVMARRFTTDCEPKGEAFIVSKYDGEWQSGVGVTAAEDGQFAIAYSVHGEPTFDMEAKKAIKPATVFAQRFSACGGAIDAAPFKVNQDAVGTHALGSTNAARIAWGPQDQLAFAWNGNIDGDSSGIGLTVIAPESLDLAAPAQVERVASSNDIALADVNPPVRDPNWQGDTPRDPGVQAVGPDFGFQSWTTTEWQPPDPDLAVGPDHIVTVVNMRIKIHEKDGTELSQEYLEDFWGALGADYFVFDPVAQWDPHAERFVVVSAEHEGGNSSRSHLDVAVSKTSDPTDGWHKYRFSLSSIGTFFDFENLGIGTDAIYVSADYFGGTGNVIHILEKAPMLNGQSVTLDWVNTTSNIVSLGSVDTFDQNAPAQYFMSAFYGSNVIRLMAITDPLGNPQLTQRNVSVSGFSSPPGAAQQGTSNRLSTVDQRTKHGVYRNGSLYVGHAIGENNTARVRWYEFEMNGWPTSGQNPSLAQEGTINLGSGQHSWFQDIGVDEEGDIVIVANRSSSSDYPFVSRFVHKAGDPAGSVRAEVRLIESNGYHTGGRWGDYAGVDEDPAEPGVFWSHHEYNEGNGTNWRTWVGRVDSDESMVLTVPALIRGQNASIVCEVATPSKQAFLAYSLVGLGSKYVPALDVTIDLQNPKLAKKTTANTSGVATFTVPVPSGAPVGPVWFQAAQTGNTSNVEQGAIQ